MRLILEIEAQGGGRIGRRWGIGAILRDGKFRAANLLSTKEVADRLYGLELVIKIGLEVEFHEIGFQSGWVRQPAGRPISSRGISGYSSKRVNSLSLHRVVELSFPSQ